MAANLHELYPSNFRDPVATLREIADEIESGKVGPVGSIAVVVFGNTLEVYRAGVDAEVGTTVLLLEAGILRLARAIEEHGREG